VKSIKQKIINSFNIQEKIAFSGIKFINKKIMSHEMSLAHGSGVNEPERAPRFIISLTSYPARTNELHYTLHSLLSQTFKPDKIVLWLNEKQFPDHEKGLPDSILSMVNRGLTICFYEHDFRSFLKLVPSLQHYPDDVIITVDDDICYGPTWLEQLVKAYDKDPVAVHACMAREIELRPDGKPRSYRKWHHYCFYRRPRGNAVLVFPLGCGGVLYPPHCLHGDILDPGLFMALAPSADDIWFWAMRVLKGTPAKLVGHRFRELTYVNAERELGLTGQSKLTSFNIQEGGNDRQFEAVLGHYPELRERLSRPS
jgi:hypothetical protein